MEDIALDNSTNSTELDYEPYEKRIETYLVPILFSIIFVSGVVGNWTVCVIFVKHPSIRNVPNTYVLLFFALVKTVTIIVLVLFGKK